MKKKGLSPVVATVILIAMVVIIALIIFLWFRSMMKEQITKFGGENIQLSCDRVSLDKSYSNGKLYFSNTGTVSVYSLKVRLIKSTGYETKDISDIVNWPTTGLNVGGAFSGDVNSGFFNGINSIIVFPVLIGNGKTGQETYVCSEDRYGSEITISP